MDPNDSFNFIVQDNDEFEDVADHSSQQVMEYFWYFALPNNRPGSVIFFR